MKHRLLPTILALACAACSRAPLRASTDVVPTPEPAPPPVAVEIASAAPPPAAVEAAVEAPREPGAAGAPEAPARACGARPSPAEIRRELAGLGKRALAAIERGDARGFARLVHPSRGLSLGLFGTVSHHLDARDVGAALGDDAPRAWNGRSNMADEPLSLSYRGLFALWRRSAYTRADLVGYGEVVQEDTLCGGPCVADEIAAAFPCAPFIQYAYATGTAANPGMWHFLVVAFDRDGAGWHVIGLLQDAWSP
jgi:hypothetical protein